MAAVFLCRPVTVKLSLGIGGGEPEMFCLASEKGYRQNENVDYASFLFSFNVKMSDILTKLNYG